MTGVLRWLFLDRTSGRIVVAQVPNVALWVFLLALAAEHVVPSGSPTRVAHGIALCALFVWALDELIRGVNPWRRLLGLCVLAFLLVRTLPR